VVKEVAIEVGTAEEEADTANTMRILSNLKELKLELKAKKEYLQREVTEEGIAEAEAAVVIAERMPKELTLSGEIRILKAQRPRQKVVFKETDLQESITRLKKALRVEKDPLTSLESNITMILERTR
jgi:hypothetical protein